MLRRRGILILRLVDDPPVLLTDWAIAVFAAMSRFLRKRCVFVLLLTRVFRNINDPFPGWGREVVPPLAVYLAVPIA